MAFVFYWVGSLFSQYFIVSESRSCLSRFCVLIVRRLAFSIAVFVFKCIIFSLIVIFLLFFSRLDHQMKHPILKLQFLIFFLTKLSLFIFKELHIAFCDKYKHLFSSCFFFCFDSQTKQHIP